MNTNANAAPAGGDDDYIDDSVLAEMEAAPPLSSKPEEVEPAATGDDTVAAATAEQGIAAPADITDPEQGTVDAKGKFVPHAKFNELYHRNKTLEQRTNQLLGIIEQFQRGGQREQQAAEPVKPKGPPEDPIERINWAVERLSEEDARQAQQSQEQKTQQEWATYYQQVERTAAQDYQAAVAEDPTLPEAYNFLITAAKREMIAFGATPEQAEAELRRQEVQAYADANQRGMTAADVIRLKAQARGWQPKSVAAQAQPQVDPAAQEQRRQQHMSLSQLGGKAGKTGITAKDLANMDEDSFAQLSDSTVKALMGGR